VNQNKNQGREKIVFNIKRLFVPAALISVSFLGVSAVNAQNPACYTQASIQGSWAIVGTYGSNIAIAIGQRYIDASGNLTGVYVLNAPTIGDPNGARTISTGTQAGTYTVNCDGTGVVNRTVTSSLGIVTTTVDNFMITGAVVINGQFIATTITDVQQTPSSLIAGGIFLFRTYTRLPDRPGPTQP
jgi:hypothetical protein